MEVTGLKLSVITAGFVGGIISLALVRDLNPYRALMTVAAGTASAAYLTPIVLHYTQLDESTEHALGFILGVTGMNALAGFFKLSESFANAPISTLKGVKRDKEKK